MFWAKVEADQKSEHKNITYRHNLAKIKLRNQSDQKQMKNKIEDLFWPISDWPPFVVEVLMSPTLDYNERLKLATFFHGNGIRNPEFPTEIIRFYNRHWMKHHNAWKQKWYKFGKLFEFLDKALDSTDSEYHSMGRTYYYYNMIVKHMLFYNGNKREKGKAADFDVNHFYY